MDNWAGAAGDVLAFEKLFEIGKNRNSEADNIESEINTNGQHYHILSLFGQQVLIESYSSIQHNVTQAKDPSWKVPKPLVVVIRINGEPAHTMIDLGLLGDFISSTLVQQLGI